MRVRSRVLASILAGAVMAATAAFAGALSPPASPPAAPTAEQRLAGEVMRAALTTAAATPVMPETLEAAGLLASEAVELDPNSVGLWRLALDIATLAEREDLRAAAVENLGRLDPSDENIRLLRLTLAMDRYQTVEERAAAYERLLSDDSVERIGAATASRLALDYALLRQRMGDTDGFSRWLSKALELDRSNRSAAALAAGFFQANIKDAFGRAEMLTNLVLADPTDVQTEVALAQLLLESGAYTAAARMYGVVASGLKSSHRPPSNDLMADIAMAQWAAGQIEDALATIDRRQNDIDEAYRLERSRADRTLTLLELDKLKGPVEPTLAAVAAVIHADRHDDKAAAALQTALEASEAEIRRLEGATPPPEPADIAARRLQIAWLALWLGGDAAKAAQHVDAADKLQPLSEEARQRFEGWQALKQGQMDRALQLLQPLVEQDTAARVGAAVALEAAGRAKDSARELLALNRAQPGSLIGIWAAGQLARILGQRVPLTSAAAEMERLIASISTGFDRYARDSSMAVAVRVTPANPNPGAFDPIWLTIELTNVTTMPLAIDRDGPLRPQVLIVPAYNTSLNLKSDPKAFVIDLDSRLRLLPRETVSTTFDLRWYGPGAMLNAIAATGGLVKLSLITNFVATGDGNIIPGLYGTETQAPLLRVNGVRKEPEWLQRAIAQMSEANADPEALMLQIALAGSELALQAHNRGITPEQLTLLLKARDVIPGAFARLSAPQQAWALAVLHDPAPIDAVLAMARKSDSRLVRLAYMLYHLSSANDPMLDAARRGDDPNLRRLAELLGNVETKAAMATPATASSSPSTAASGPATRSSTATAPAAATMPTAPATSPASVPTTAPAPSGR